MFGCWGWVWRDSLSFVKARFGSQGDVCYDVLCCVLLMQGLAVVVRLGTLFYGLVLSDVAVAVCFIGVCLCLVRFGAAVMAGPSVFRKCAAGRCVVRYGTLCQGS